MKFYKVTAGVLLVLCLGLLAVCVKLLGSIGSHFSLELVPLHAAVMPKLALTYFTPASALLLFLGLLGIGLTRPGRPSRLAPVLMVLGFLGLAFGLVGGFGVWLVIERAFDKPGRTFDDMATWVVEVILMIAGGLFTGFIGVSAAGLMKWRAQKKSEAVF